MSTEASFFGLTGKKALIIGGGQGMGESTALFLGPRRLRRRPGPMSSPNEPMRWRQRSLPSGDRALPSRANVLEDQQISGIVAESEARLGGLDVMVSIVGAAVWGPLLQTTAEVWTRQMQLNLRYFFLLAKQVAQSFVQRDQAGAIVAIASVDGQRAAPMRGVYGRGQSRSDQSGADNGGRMGTAPHSGQRHRTRPHRDAQAV